MPGGQISNLRQQAIALGLGDRFEEIEELYAEANRILGNIVKVTPSKVVGDLALYLCGADADADEFDADPASFDLPDSVIGFLRGELGVPPGGWPEPFRTKALAGRRRPTRPSSCRPTPRRPCTGPDAPGPSTGCCSPVPQGIGGHRDEYGDTSRLTANQFFYGLRSGEEHRVQLERGVQLLIGPNRSPMPTSAACAP